MDVPSNWYLKTAGLEDGACGACGFCPFCVQTIQKKRVRGEFPMHGFYASSIGALTEKVIVASN